MTLIFYDTETTGIDPYFDQILQFAAIKTDDQFNELDRFEIRCRLLPHIVPHPKAMMVTGVSAEMLTDASLPSHYEMMTIVRRKLEDWGPSVFVGYNSLRFDEAMLRSAFYQTLQPIYLTTSNLNGRTDALILMQASSVFAPDLLKIPTRENGKATYALDQLAPANGNSHKNAHDALADVEATIFMTKKVATAAPEIWRRMHAASQKRIVREFIESDRAFLLTEFYFNKAHTRPVVVVGNDPRNSNTLYALSLDDDFDELFNLQGSDLVKRLASSPKQVRRIKTNSSPLITSLEKAVSYPQFESLDIQKINKRLAQIQENKTLRDFIVETTAENERKYELEPNAEVEELLYGGFYSRADERLIAKFHSLQWAQKASVVNEFDDVRLRTLATRLVYNFDPELLERTARFECDLGISRRFSAEGSGVRWLTPRTALTTLDELRVGATAKDSEILAGLESLYNRQIDQFSAP